MKKHNDTTVRGAMSRGSALLLLAAALAFGLSACDQAYMMPGDGGFDEEPNVESVEFGLRADEVPEDGEEEALYDTPAPTGGTGYVIDYARSERRSPKDPSSLRHPDPKPWHTKGQ